MTAGESHDYPQQVEPPETAAPVTDACVESEPDRVYLDLTPVKSFLHSTGGAQAQASSLPRPPGPELPTEAVPADQEPTSDEPTGSPLEPICRDTQVGASPPPPSHLNQKFNTGPTHACRVPPMKGAVWGPRTQGAAPEKRHREDSAGATEHLLSTELP